MFWKKETILIVLVFTLFLGAQIVKADFTFGEPTNLGPTVNSPDDEFAMSISADELMIVFSSNRPGGNGKMDLYVTTRPTKNNEWTEAINLGSTVNTSSGEGNPALSADGLSLYFNSNRPGGLGYNDIYVSTRESTDADWGEPVNVGPPINTSGQNHNPFISADGLEFYFLSNFLFQNKNFDICLSTRETKDAPWGEPVNIGPPVNTEYEEHFPKLSADGLTLFFSSGMYGGAEDGRPGFGDSDIWFTTRKTKDADWREPVNIGPSVNSAAIEWCPTISADGSTLYFVFDAWDYPVPDRGNLGWGDLCKVSIEPVVDLNSDGIVDAADMCIIVDNWHTENTLCDIAPPPLGDGFVDVQDLIVLAEHLFEEFPPVEPVE
jgi:Tol biopolymer transport system component